VPANDRASPQPLPRLQSRLQVRCQPFAPYPALFKGSLLLIASTLCCANIVYQ